MTTTDQLAGIAAKYRAALRSCGQAGLDEFDLRGYDRTGIPVQAVVWDADDGWDAHGVGYGTSTAAAMVGALGEAAERVLMRAAVAALPTVRASYTDLRGQHGPDGVLDPVTLVLDAGCAYDEARPLTWVPALRWRTGERVLVPREFALSAPEPEADGLITPVTNGLGAGDTLERAVAHGLLELVQRDGDNVRFRALDRGVVIDLDECPDPEVQHARGLLRAAGIEPMVKLASTELACVVYCVGADPDEQTPPMTLGAVGEAAHPDRGVAVAKALLEYASSRARRVFAFGPFAEVRRRHPRYAAAELQRGLGEQEPRALEAMRAWAGWNAAQMRAAVAPLLAERSRVPWGSLPSSPARAPAEILQLLLERVGDVLVVPGAAGGMYAAKVLCPGLEVETMSYLRIGERAAADLLARDTGLVGRGRPTRSGQLPIHLTTAAQQRLGGPVHLDAEAVRRTVGELYPLYREPRRHAVDRSA